MISSKRVCLFLLANILTILQSTDTIPESEIRLFCKLTKLLHLYSTFRLFVTTYFVSPIYLCTVLQVGLAPIQS